MLKLSEVSNIHNWNSDRILPTFAHSSPGSSRTHVAVHLQRFNMQKTTILQDACYYNCASYNVTSRKKWSKSYMYRRTTPRLHRDLIKISNIHQMKVSIFALNRESSNHRADSIRHTVIALPVQNAGIVCSVVPLLIE